jgi:hypothetical protein
MPLPLFQYESNLSVKLLMMEKTLVRPRLNRLVEGDVHLGILSVYAKHLVSVEDPDRAACNAGLLYLIIIVLFSKPASPMPVESQPDSRDWYEGIRGKCILYYHSRCIERQIRL